MKKQKVEFTISRSSGSDGESISIEITDPLSHIQFVDVDMELSDFARLITGLGCVEAIGELRGLENVGKKRVTENRNAVCPLKLSSNRELLKKWLEENCQEEGWIIDTYLGSSESISWNYGDNTTTLRYRVFKYVPVNE